MLCAEAAKAAHFLETPGAPASAVDASVKTEITGPLLYVREVHTADRWETSAWTPLSWAVPLGKR